MQRRDFIKASIGATVGVGALLASPATALMATIPLPERRAAVQGIFRVATEDYVEAGRLLNYLNQAFPGFTWATYFREQALIWQPFIASGLSIPQFCDEVERFAAIFAGNMSV